MEDKIEKVKISEDIMNEVEDLLDIDKGGVEEIRGNVIYDGKQYTLKIPKKIANAVGINAEKDSFIFKIETYTIEQRKRPSLTIVLERGQE